MFTENLVMKRTLKLDFLEKAAKNKLFSYLLIEYSPRKSKNSEQKGFIKQKTKTRRDLVTDLNITLCFHEQVLDKNQWTE